VQPPGYVFDRDRLEALAQFDILDTAPEQGFDDIVELASRVCQTPVALVSLVAGDRQWFKARIGFDECQTNLSSSVCAHALIEPDLLVVPDLSRDARTRSNPLVTGPPRIRFYAGAPLRTAQGAVLGSLCVIDTEPRPEGLSANQADSLKNLARQVIAQMELRRAVAERDKALAAQRLLEDRRKASEAQYKLLFDSIDSGFCIVEMKFAGGVAVDYRFKEVNPAFARHTGLADAQGKWMRELVPTHEQYWFDVYGRVASGGEPVRFEFQARGLEDRWFDVHAFRVGRPDAGLVGILFNDISGRRETEQLQTVLNHELSHRLKNTMALVQAVASQTLKSVPDQTPVRAFADRVLALSIAHDLLLRKNWTAASFGDIVDAVVCTFGDGSRFDVSGPRVLLGSRATLSLSLLLHELTTNAVKYGALSDAREAGGTTGAGRVTIAWKTEEDGGVPALRLAWRERGGPPAREPTRKGFGSKLVGMGLAGTGGAELSYSPSGFEAVFSASLADLQN